MPFHLTEQYLMKICDLCRRVVGNLELNPGGFENIEACQDCYNDLSARLRQVELKVAESKRQWRTEAFSEWKKVRTVPDSRIS